MEVTITSTRRGRCDDRLRSEQFGAPALRPPIAAGPPAQQLPEERVPRIQLDVAGDVERVQSARTESVVAVELFGRKDLADSAPDPDRCRSRAIDGHEKDPKGRVDGRHRQAEIVLDLER